MPLNNEITFWHYNHDIVDYKNGTSVMMLYNVHDIVWHCAMSASWVEININNIQTENDYSPYCFWDVKADVKFVKPTEVEKGKPQCDLCFQFFPTFSALCTHQGLLIK